MFLARVKLASPRPAATTMLVDNQVVHASAASQVYKYSDSLLARHNCKHSLILHTLPQLMHSRSYTGFEPKQRLKEPIYKYPCLYIRVRLETMKFRAVDGRATDEDDRNYYPMIHLGRYKLPKEVRKIIQYKIAFL